MATFPAASSSSGEVEGVAPSNSASTATAPSRSLCGQMTLGTAEFAVLGIERTDTCTDEERPTAAGGNECSRGAAPAAGDEANLLAKVSPGMVMRKRMFLGSSPRDEDSHADSCEKWRYERTAWKRLWLFM